MNFLDININTSLCISLTGTVNITGRNEHFRRTPSEYILYIITDGRMLIVENDTRYELSKGDSFIFTPGYTHYGLPSTSDISYIYIHFYIDSSCSANAHSQIQFPKYRTNSFALLSQLNLMFNEIENLRYTRSYYYQSECSCILMRMLILISRSEHNAAYTQNEILIQSVIYFLNKNLSRKLSSRDIENNFHMNYDYLNRVFSHHMGTTIINYHNMLRIDEADKLLGSGVYNVRQTAEKLGFNNEFYFSKVYRKFKGVPPSTML